MRADLELRLERMNLEVSITVMFSFFEHFVVEHTSHSRV